VYSPLKKYGVSFFVLRYEVHMFHCANEETMIKNARSPKYEITPLVYFEVENNQNLDLGIKEHHRGPKSRQQLFFSEIRTRYTYTDLA
jgi:hypothetical protein